MTTKSLKLYECGYCIHPEKIVNPKGGWKKMAFPAIVGLIKHSEIGYVLFDTGYASHFLDATKKFPYSIYAKLTPVHFSEDKSIKSQLIKDGIQPEDIKLIILSHFHGDHTAALKDFPTAKILTFEKGYNDIKYNSNFRALTKGCLKKTLPNDLEQRMLFIDKTTPITLDEQFGKFETGFQIFHDDSAIAVDLSGHAIGQVGVFLSLSSGKRIFLCADAVWLSHTYKTLTFPHKIANLLIADKKSYIDNIYKLHHLSLTRPEIDILPTHCSTTWEKAKEGYVYE